MSLSVPPSPRQDERRCGHPRCDRPLGPRNRSGYCGPHFPLGEYAYRPCLDCGKVLGPRSRKGRCVSCHARHVGKLYEKPPKPCSVDGCSGRMVARGWCHKHWSRWRAGTPVDRKTVHDLTPVEWFWSKVDVGHPLGCWEWVGTKTRLGYGVLSVAGRQEKAHRRAFELLRGHIPKGLVIDHLCRNTACVNPDHLEAVTNTENVLRGYSVPAKRARGEA